jgi:hypothetical protein
MGGESHLEQTTYLGGWKRGTMTDAKTDAFIRDRLIQAHSIPAPFILFPTYDDGLVLQMLTGFWDKIYSTS